MDENGRLDYIWKSGPERRRQASKDTLWANFLRAIAAHRTTGRCDACDRRKETTPRRAVSKSTGEVITFECCTECNPRIPADVDLDLSLIRWGVQTGNHPVWVFRRLLGIKYLEQMGLRDPPPWA